MRKKSIAFAQTSRDPPKKQILKSKNIPNCATDFFGKGIEFKSIRQDNLWPKQKIASYFM